MTITKISAFLDQKNFTQHKLIFWLVILVALGAFLRLYSLESKAILFGDAGRDLLVAKQAVQNNELPLLGIPSSVPRFKQGPVSIWYSMIIIKLFGSETYPLSIAYALLSIIALIVLYEFVCITVNQKTALLATLMTAISPLAIASARVPYHTTPIPLFMMIYLIALFRLWKKMKLGLFFAGLSFALLFQFELALAPTVLVIPFVLWRSGQLRLLISKRVGWLILGLVIGLLPQIIFDLTHNFAQLGVFGLWIGHKVFEFMTFQGAAETNPWFLIKNLFLYNSRVLAVSRWIGIPLLVVQVGSLMWLAWRKWSPSKKKGARKTFLPLTGQLVLAVILSLLVGYVIHGAPSEAYFPAFTVLVPILSAIVVFELPKKWSNVMIGSICLVAITNVIFIFQYNFFVSTYQSWTYGPGVGEQKQILAFIANKQDEQGYKLRTIAQYEDKFASHFANYEWIAHDINLPGQTDEGQSYFLANPGEHVRPNYLKQEFVSVTVSWSPVGQ